MKAWEGILGDQKQQAYFQDALAYVEARRVEGVTVYPEAQDVFNAFKLTSPNNLKVVVLGQDPYHGPNQAHGLSFSVLKGNKIPPSLRNIYKELSSDIEGFVAPVHGDLSEWAKQGVLLLNTVLTVEQGEAHSHKNIGWERFTDEVIKKINEHFDNIVFLLWGAPAQKKMQLISEERQKVLTSAHPSPLSAHRGFLGCKHFSQTNAFLKEIGKTPIDWQV
jgi:uracil-DNA glycosylase